jgi:hypothetical protein
MAPSSISAAASPVVDGLENRFQVAPAEAQAVGKNGIMGEDPNKGYYVSATSLRFNNEMHKTTNFLDAEEIPYVVLPYLFGLQDPVTWALAGRDLLSHFKFSPCFQDKPVIPVARNQWQQTDRSLEAQLARYAKANLSASDTRAVSGAPSDP